MNLGNGTYYNNQTVVYQTKLLKLVVVRGGGGGSVLSGALGRLGVVAAGGRSALGARLLDGTAVVLGGAVADDAAPLGGGADGRGRRGGGGGRRRRSVAGGEVRLLEVVEKSRTEHEEAALAAVVGRSEVSTGHVDDGVGVVAQRAFADPGGVDLLGGGVAVTPVGVHVFPGRLVTFAPVEGVDVDGARAAAASERRWRGGLVAERAAELLFLAGAGHDEVTVLASESAE